MNLIETLLTDGTALITVVFGAFLILLLGYLLGLRKKHREENEGEAAVRKALVNYCRTSTAHVLNNITLRHADGTTQIDHILVTQNGILVIETKHYTGWIFAHEKQQNWTQVIFKVKSKFQNPIIQNSKHVNAVRNLLNFIPIDQIQGAVVFTGNAEFKTSIPESVLSVDDLIARADSMRLGDISENRVQFCVGRLECARFEITEQTDVEHQAYLEKKFGKVE